MLILVMGVFCVLRKINFAVFFQHKNTCFCLYDSVETPPDGDHVLFMYHDFVTFLFFLILIM